MAIPYYSQANTPSAVVPFLELTVLFDLVLYVFETYLDVRQHRTFSIKDIPQKLTEVVGRLDKEQALKPKEDEPKVEVEGEEEEEEEEETKKKDTRPLLEQIGDKFAKSQDYGKDKSSFGFFSGAIGQFDGTLCLLLGWMPYAWDIATQWCTFIGLDSSNEIYVSLMFLVVTSIKDEIIGLPFSLYRTFVIEEKHGFNKQTIGLFFSDKVKSTALSIVIGFPVVSGLIYIIKWGGEHFYIYVWFALFVFALVMMTIYPEYIAPLFNKYDALPDGSLREKIEALAGSLDYPLKKLYVVDGSKRSSHSNAYCYGFGSNKRIVIFDTLIKQATEMEIVGILGHELGHWKMWHTISGFAISQAYTFCAFAAFGLCLNNTDMYSSFGFAAKPTFVGLMLFLSSIWAPVDKVLSFFLTVNSRRNEFQADEFGVGLGYSTELQSGLTKIHLESLANLSPDPLYSAYHHSHPPLVERLCFMEECAKKGGAAKKKAQ
jgi:STE24 endopeptidase